MTSLIPLVIILSVAITLSIVLRHLDDRREAKEEWRYKFVPYRYRVLKYVCYEHLKAVRLGDLAFVTTRKEQCLFCLDKRRQ